MTPKTATTKYPQTTPSSHSKNINPTQHTQQTDLLQIFNILTLAYHRNKNQHRRSRWWKELSLLRRNLRRLLAESEKEKEKEKEGFEKRTSFLREWLLPRCWEAFSGLVGDNQYAALGLMLLGALARLGRVLGLDLKAEEAAGEPNVGHEASREENMAVLGHEGVRVDEDLGVPLAREEIVETAEAQKKQNEKENARSQGEAAVVETEKLPPRKKRKKKHRDAIDELFSGLV
jgi:ribonuclease MRP protein subunit RMP1